MKKILLTLGSISAIAAPVAAVVSCGNNAETEIGIHQDIELSTALELPGTKMDLLLNDLHDAFGFTSTNYANLALSKNLHWNATGSQADIAALAITFKVMDAEGVSLNGLRIPSGATVRAVSGIAPNNLGHGLLLLYKPATQNDFVIMSSQALGHGVEEKLLSTFIKLMSWTNPNAEVDMSVLNAVASNINAAQTSTLNASALDTLLTGKAEGFVTSATDLGISPTVDARVNITYKLKAHDATKHQAIITVVISDPKHPTNKVEKEILISPT